MMKPTSTYKMSKASKIMLAMTWSRPGKRARHRSVIDAELHSRLVVKQKRDRPTDQ